MSRKRKGRIDKHKQQALIIGRVWPTVRRYANIEAKPILIEIKNRTRKTDQIVRKALINYMIIRSMAMLEHFLVNELKKFVDQYTNKIDLADFITNPSDFKKDSKSKVLISSFSYSNPKDIQFVFSRLLHINFFDEIKQESKEYAPYFSLEQEHIPYTKPIHKNWNELMQIFKLRHDIVHHNKLVNLQYHKIRNFVGGMMHMVHCADMVIHFRRRIF